MGAGDLGSPLRQRRQSGKPKDGDPRAAWTLLTVETGEPVQVEILALPNIASMAEAIRDVDGTLLDQFARDIETGGDL